MILILQPVDYRAISFDVKYHVTVLLICWCTISYGAVCCFCVFQVFWVGQRCFLLQNSEGSNQQRSRTALFEPKEREIFSRADIATRKRLERREARESSQEAAECLLLLNATSEFETNTSQASEVGEDSLVQDASTQTDIMSDNTADLKEHAEYQANCKGT